MLRMEHIWSMKNAGDLGGTAMKEDARLNRRLLRRGTKKSSRVPKNIRFSSCSNKDPKKIITNENQNNVDSDCGEDSDYLEFLSDRKHYFGHDVNVEDGDDLDYVLFMSNLEEFGKSYVLKLAPSDGMPAFVKYYEVDGPDNELYIDNQKTRKTYPNKILSSHSVREKCESQRRILRTNSEKKIKNLRRVSGSNSERRKTESPGRVLTSNSAREKIKSSRKTLRSDSGSENNIDPSILLDVVNKEKIDSPMFLKRVSRGSMGTQKKQRDDPNIDKKRPVVETNVKMEAENPVSRTRNGYSRKRPGIEVTPLAKRKCNREMESDFADESYQVFLNCLKMDGHCLVYTPEGGDKKVVYEEDEVEKGKESDSDSDLIMMDDVPYPDGNYTPFVSPKFHRQLIDLEDEECIGRPVGSRESQFREKLMEILQKPYDQREYRNLLNEASQQKPLTGARDLRNGIKEYPTENKSKSYLEQYSDLAEKIDQVKSDRCRTLNLLRGFIYWLKNVSTQGAFKPWLDSSCSNVLPSDRECNITRSQRKM